VYDKGSNLKASQKKILNLFPIPFLDENSGKIAIHFIDEGIGIDEDQKEDILGPFVRGIEADDEALLLSARDNIGTSGVGEQFSGLGIGLAIVKRVVDLYNGEISISSKVGAGSCFSLILPEQIVLYD